MVVAELSCHQYYNHWVVFVVITVTYYCTPPHTSFSPTPACKTTANSSSPHSCSSPTTTQTPPAPITHHPTHNITDHSLLISTLVTAVISHAFSLIS